MDKMTEQEIRERAYALWEKEGSPAGRDAEFWERAELMAKASGAASPNLNQSTSATDKATDVAVEESFPASDPPSFAAPARAGGRGKRR